MKKICFLVCGGTLMMKRDASGTLKPFYDADVLLSFVPQLKKVAEITLVKLSNLDSSNLDPRFWTKLITTLHELEKKFDGFVITHGTDTMAYTASAVSFALRQMDKPIVFTGAQKPIEDVPSDAPNNLINATLVASGKHTGVMIVFGSKILQANRATKVSESTLDAFDSPMVASLGEIALAPIFHSSVSVMSEKPRGLHVSFDSRVVVVQVTPGLSRYHLKALLSANVRGIIFEAFGPGNMPETLLPIVREARELGVAVVILSQCRRGITRMQLYEVGHAALEAGAMPGGDMTVEAAYTKLAWILSQTRNPKAVRLLFSSNIAGEVSHYD